MDVLLSFCSIHPQAILLEKVEGLEGQLKTAVRSLNGARNNAKFDKIALEGRTKTALVLEHTVATLRHDLETNVERRQVLNTWEIPLLCCNRFSHSNTQSTTSS